MRSRVVVLVTLVLALLAGGAHARVSSTVECYGAVAPVVSSNSSFGIDEGARMGRAWFLGVGSAFRPWYSLGAEAGYFRHHWVRYGSVYSGGSSGSDQGRMVTLSVVSKFTVPAVGPVRPYATVETGWGVARRLVERGWSPVTGRTTTTHYSTKAGHYSAGGFGLRSNWRRTWPAVQLECRVGQLTAPTQDVMFMPRVMLAY